MADRDVVHRLNAALENRYRVERELGVGGMATVFLADDVKHDRKVALKVLKPELAAVVGAERFLTEIKTTANLQHPHILPLFDSGEADGFLFYVMPYVEGESLRELLDRESQLPVDRAVELIRRVASALQHAHDRGIVHRDIKPANILLSEGEPLVADFGIALAVSSAGDGRITETGLSLGTPHYMSPEQASGDRSLDPRSDVYALGCVLYEALAGEPPFPGPTPQAVLARILTGTAQRVSTARPTVPTHVDAAVARALERLPADRFPTVEDFRKALVDPAFTHTGSAAATDPAHRRDSGHRGSTTAAVAGGFVLMIFVAAWGWLAPREAPGYRIFDILLEEPRSEVGPAFALSPDGSTVAYVSGPGITLRSLETGETRHFGGANSRTPFFSPDGEAVGYHRGRPGNDELRWVRTTGGGSIRVAQNVFPGGSWHQDGYIYFSDGDDRSLWRVWAEGGVPERLPQPDSIQLTWPWAIPGERRLLVLASPATEQAPGAALYDPADGSIDRIEGAGLEQVRDARHAGGYLFWVDLDYNLLAARLDLGGSRLTSPAVTLATGVLSSGLRGATNLAVSSDGTVLLALGVSSRAGLGENLAWVELDGSVTVIEERLADQFGDFDGLALSPDERYIAAQVQPSDDVGSAEIWIFDTRQATVYPLTFDGATHDPEWLPGGRIVYLEPLESGGSVVHAQPFDRSAPESELLTLDRRISGVEVAPDGTLLLTLEPEEEDGRGRGLYTAQPGDPGSLRPFLDTPFDEWLAEISPDGRWVAYVSLETGQSDIYVRSFPGGGRPWPISTNGGTNPFWGPASDRIYFRSDQTLRAAVLDLSDGVEVSRVDSLFPIQPFELSGYASSRDGERLLMIREAEGAGGARSQVLMLNVFTEIERRLSR